MDRSTTSEVLTVAEVAEYLRIHRCTIYRLIKARKLPYFKIGSDYRFNREQIDQWRLRQDPGWAEASEKAAKTDKPT
jgi:excisionase family DNA binding protein